MRLYLFSLLMAFATNSLAAQVDLDLEVAKAHHDFWKKECQKKPKAEVKQCVADLEKAYAQAQKDIKAKHKGDAK